jgi:hypothetical protein
VVLVEWCRDADKHGVCFTQSREVSGSLAVARQLLHRFARNVPHYLLTTVNLLDVLRIDIEAEYGKASAGEVD